MVTCTKLKIFQNPRRVTNPFVQGVTLPKISEFLRANTIIILTIAGKQTQSEQDDASFNDLICDLEFACLSSPQGAER